MSIAPEIETLLEREPRRDCVFRRSLLTGAPASGHARVLKPWRPFETVAHTRLANAGIDLHGAERDPPWRDVDLSLDRQEVGPRGRGERLRSTSLVKAVVAVHHDDASIGAHADVARADVDRRVRRVERGGRGECACPAVIADGGRRSRRPCHEPNRQGGKRNEQGAKHGTHRDAVWIGRAKRGKCRERKVRGGAPRQNRVDQGVCSNSTRHSPPKVD
jgi:hypothetical protein